MEVNDKYYERILLKNSSYHTDIVKICNVVKRYIIREKLMLTGGMAIDFALKSKGQKGIYRDDDLADYDFLSAHHYVDAYRIAEWLARLGYKNISVINALHPSTMRVRVNLISVADVTYVPENVLSKIPYFVYRGFYVIHPHAQMIDQHRALCYLYENVPLETILSPRPWKDMTRYDKLYEHFPIRLLFVKNTNLSPREVRIPLSTLQNQCISGFLALGYWISYAQRLGFKPLMEHTHVHKRDGHLIGVVPKGTLLTVYSNDVDALITKVDHTKLQNFNRLLDKLPKCTVLDKTWELYENHHKLSAFKDGDLYVANLQHVMVYILTKYILVMNVKDVPRDYAFYIGYIECINLFKWAVAKYMNTTRLDLKKQYKALLPSTDFYGVEEINDTYMAYTYRFDMNNQKKQMSQEWSQPKHIYDRDLTSMNIPKHYFHFDYSKSNIFAIDGLPRAD